MLNESEELKSSLSARLDHKPAARRQHGDMGLAPLVEHPTELNVS